MRWWLLRVSLLTLALFTALCESKANDEKPVDLQASDQDDGLRKNGVGGADGPRERSDISHEELCATVASVAHENGLPISFFSNLIWQESRFVRTAMSPAGAQGIAQFMPRTAAAMGVEDPFDPVQALPASARLLQGLHRRYGNLGLAAAAYNAGEPLVNRWLQRGGVLPQETRKYVLIITGFPVEKWKGDAARPQTFPLAKRMPCRHYEAFFAPEAPAETKMAEAPAPKNDLRRKLRKQTSGPIRIAKLNKRLLKRGPKQGAPARTASVRKRVAEAM